MGPHTSSPSRSVDAYATFVFTKPDGMTRALYFVRGALLGADTSQADCYPQVAGEKQNDSSPDQGWRGTLRTP
ncbi:MAG: hypothetical protein V2I51_17380 [Anderseniella sp.]|jgi:hypothetical protein|nr:hypothetical protein [Anderseniella sp.]